MRSCADTLKDLNIRSEQLGRCDTFDVISLLQLHGSALKIQKLSNSNNYDSQWTGSLARHKFGQEFVSLKLLSSPQSYPAAPRSVRPSYLKTSCSYVPPVPPEPTIVRISRIDASTQAIFEKVSPILTEDATQTDEIPVSSASVQCMILSPVSKLSVTLSVHSKAVQCDIDGPMLDPALSIDPESFSSSPNSRIKVSTSQDVEGQFFIQQSAEHSVEHLSKLPFNNHKDYTHGANLVLEAKTDLISSRLLLRQLEYGLKSIGRPALLDTTEMTPNLKKIAKATKNVLPHTSRMVEVTMASNQSPLRQRKAFKKKK